jgi:hypothetical protein
MTQTEQYIPFEGFYQNQQAIQSVSQSFCSNARNLPRNFFASTLMGARNFSREPRYAHPNEPAGSPGTPGPTLARPTPVAGAG